MLTTPLKLVYTLLLVVIILGGFVYFFRSEEEMVVYETPVVDVKQTQEVIGTSIENRPIQAYTFGHGDSLLLFVGGIHGGYEWNSALLAYEFIDYFTNNSESIPDNLTVTIIPSANPDGIYDVIQKEGRFTADDIVTENRDIGLGRFNANDVDLNRNFDCNWQASSMWKGSEVLAGTKAFSEPEAATIRDFIMATDPVAVVFWHSQAGAVYASECNEGVLSETLDIVNAYADAADYNAVLLFDAYEITGDAEGWLASIGIPAITVEIGTHDDIEWNKNLRGVQALFNYYSTI